MFFMQGDCRQGQALPLGVGIVARRWGAVCVMGLGLVGSAAYGQRAMPEEDAMLLRVMQDASRRLNSSASVQSVVEQARSQVSLTLIQGEPVLEEIAGKMGLSSWSLQRRLREEGISLSALVGKVR